MAEIKITKEQARRFLVRYHCLDDASGLSGKEGVMAYFARVRCVQFDPLNVIGHNQELILRARVSGFTPGMLTELLYTDRQLYDQWDKNMSICMTEDWPYFSRFRDRYLPWIDKHSDAVQTITRYLEGHECACSSDFAMEERVEWHYGPQRLAKAALESPLRSMASRMAFIWLRNTCPCWKTLSMANQRHPLCGSWRRWTTCCGTGNW